uniref:uncharacterized protein LOC122603844 n=1 Tax=Erigeron canadensis TaxID=72917 RepID=UPI001CB906E6|nr:uncharacterized protein LOC122603844 [Erigeron canadensis]
MKEHEDGVLPIAVEKSKSSVIVDQVVTETVGVLDVMVDVIGCDDVVDDHGCVPGNLGNDSESKGMKKTEARDMVTKEDVGLGEIKVLGFEKDKGIVGGDVGVMNGKELIERGLKISALPSTMDAGSENVDVVNEKIGKGNEGLDSSKISEPSATMDPGSEDVDVVVVDNGIASIDEAQRDVLVDPTLVGPDNATLLTEVVSSATGDGDFNVRTENLDERVEVDTLSKSGILHPKSEIITEESQNIKSEVESNNSNLAVESSTGEPQMVAKEETEKGLIKDGEIMEKSTEYVQQVAYGKGVLNQKTGKGDEALDSSEVPESLKTVNLGQEEVNGETFNADVVQHPEFLYEDPDMEKGDDVGVDIDEVLGWNDEIPRVTVIGGALGKEQDLKSNAQSEVDVEQVLPEPSTEPVLTGHEEENLESREPIVYGRRANVEVPVYEGMDGIIPPILGDENLEIETDSDEDGEPVQEEEQKVTEPSLNVSSFSFHQSRYFQPPKNEGEFCVSDLVWGKVRSHPWWPGQIVDPSGASQKAMKYHKKNCFLVAYFGDHSFAWNDSAVLKPFRANFSQIEKQTNLESFKNAVECALEEVTRRVELGLACSCVPQDIYKKIQCQIIENGGVRKKAAVRHGSDESASVSSFEPHKLVDYVRSLAQFPHEGDKLDLAIAKAQLSSYGRYKGYQEPSEFRVYEDMLEDAPREAGEQVKSNADKFQNILIETAYPNKDLSLSDVTDEAPESGHGDNDTSKPVSSSNYKKRKARDIISNGSVKRPNRRPDKVSTAPISTPKPSFKIGEMIQRVAIQLTGPPLKAYQDVQDADQLVGSDVSLQTFEIPQKEASIAEMLLQLHVTAQDPMKEHTFLHTIIPFFYDRRSAVFSKSLKKVSTSQSPLTGRKRKASTEKDPEEVEASGSERKASIENDELEVGGSKAKESSANDPEEYEFVFDDINDSYWTDRIIQNPSEDQSLQDHQNGGLEYQVVAYELDKPAKKSRGSNKKCVSSIQETVKVKEEREAEKRRRENLATEIVLKFAEGIYFPSENNLNKMFRRFGPLMESETEVDKEGGRARVVFKKCCDAEIAHSSAEKFNIFGSIDVNYELNYTPLVSYKPLPLPLLQDPMDAS